MTRHRRTRGHRRIPTFLCVLTAAFGLTVLAHCSDTGQLDAGQPDGSVPDAVQPDVSVDAAAVEMRVDAAVPDVAGDAELSDVKGDAPAPDTASPDAMQPDTTPVADAAALSGNVMYLSSTSSGSLAPMKIKLDGTGKTAVSGLPASIDPFDLEVRGGVGEYLTVTRDKPVALAMMGTSAGHVFNPVYLPGKLGYLHHYHNSSKFGFGFFVVRPDGTVKDLDFIAGQPTYNRTIGINRSGTIIAALVKNLAPPPWDEKVKLLRTDGQKFGTTTSGVCDIMPAATPTFASVDSDSFNFATKHFYLIGNVGGSWPWGSSTPHLFKAPTDCSAKAIQVTLPKISGAASRPGILRLSEDEKKIALVAGSSSGNEEVMVIDDATGAVTNVSASPADYSQLDISPTGKHVAYTSRSSKGKDDLYVRPADKSSAAVHITAATSYAGDYDTVRGVQLISDDTLLFWVGVDHDELDLFHYRISSKTLTQITKTGGTTKPYTGTTTSPKLQPYYGWSSPNGKFSYTMAFEQITAAGGSRCNILSIDRATGAAKYITTNVYVDPKPSNLEATVQGDRVFFHARKSANASDENLYYFNQNTASTPVKLTSFSGTSYISFIMPSKDGSLVAFSAGTTKDDMYVVEVKATPVVHKLTTTQGDISPMKWFTSDSKSVVYGVGSSGKNIDLRVQDIKGANAAKILEPATSDNHAIMLW